MIQTLTDLHRGQRVWLVASWSLWPVLAQKPFQDPKALIEDEEVVEGVTPPTAALHMDPFKILKLTEGEGIDAPPGEASKHRLLLLDGM